MSDDHQGKTLGRQTARQRKNVAEHNDILNNIPKFKTVMRERGLTTEIEYWEFENSTVFSIANHSINVKAMHTTNPSKGRLKHTVHAKIDGRNQTIVGSKALSIFAAMRMLYNEGMGSM